MTQALGGIKTCNHGCMKGTANLFQWPLAVLQWKHSPVAWRAFSVKWNEMNETDICKTRCQPAHQDWCSAFYPKCSTIFLCKAIHTHSHTPLEEQSGAIWGSVSSPRTLWHSAGAEGSWLVDNRLCFLSHICLPSLTSVHVHNAEANQEAGIIHMICSCSYDYGINNQVCYSRFLAVKIKIWHIKRRVSVRKHRQQVPRPVDSCTLQAAFSVFSGLRSQSVWFWWRWRERKSVGG